MNAVTSIDKAAEKRARNAASARARRAAKKAVSAEMAAALNEDDRPEVAREEYAVVVIGDQTYQVSAEMTPAEQHATAKLLHQAYLNRQNGSPEAGTPDVERVSEQDAKPAKAVKLKGDPLATVFYRLSRTAMEALEGKPGAEYRKANPKDWKVLKASKKITGGQSWAFTGNLRPEAASTLAAALRTIAASEGFAKPGSLITNAAKLESNHYVTKAAEKR